MCNTQILVLYIRTVKTVLKLTLYKLFAIQYTLKWLSIKAFNSEKIVKFIVMKGKIRYNVIILKLKELVLMQKKNPPQISGTLRKFALRVPTVIKECSGIIVFGKRIKSLVFTTDVCIIRNVNADAVIAVYPFTPQPIITQAVMLAADIPVFAGVGGGLTSGNRVVNLAHYAEMQGANGVVVNAPTSNEIITKLSQQIDIPVIVTVANDTVNYRERVEAGATIFNVSAAQKTADIVKEIRQEFPDFPIIATGGPTDESILKTIEAGANAITWTPPSSGEVFKDIMDAYRHDQPHP